MPHMMSEPLGSRWTGSQRVAGVYTVRDTINATPNGACGVRNRKGFRINPAYLALSKIGCGRFAAAI
jgi:hypothetical protein